MKPRVVLILPTTTYRAEDFTEAAHHLGVSVTVASETPNVLEAAHPAGYLTLDFANVEIAIQAARVFTLKHPISAVIAVDDAGVVLAQAISEALGLSTNPRSSTQASRDKRLQRSRLTEAGIAVPQFGCLPLNAFDWTISAHSTANAMSQGHTLLAQANPGLDFPVVVKPVGLSGSRGVIRANSAPELLAALERIGVLLRTVEAERELGNASLNGVDMRSVLIEQFIPGAEVAVEGLLSGGRLRVLAIFDKPDPLDGPYFEETIYVTPSRLPAAQQEALADLLQDGVAALGLREGPVHAEFRLAPSGPVVLEIAARTIGGLCSRTLRFGLGISLEELVLRNALGLDVSALIREERAAGVMMLPIPRLGILRAVLGLEDARTVPAIEDIRITVPFGEEVVPLPEGSRYLGFAFARGDSVSIVEQALREAHRRLRFVIESVAHERSVG